MFWCGMSTRVILLGGPTASGKSRLARALARQLDGIVINADSMQVYRELRILTARPSAVSEAAVPHRLYGVLSATEACSAARWRSLALGELDSARKSGKIAILVGGSGLYFRALIRGLAPVPPVPDAVRRLARSRHAELGNEAFFAELAERDSEMASRLTVGDRQRVIRAWEVFESTGVSLAEWQRRSSVPFDGRHLALVMAPERESLYEACNRRFRDMVAAGAVREVSALLSLCLDPDLPAMKALGVRPLTRHLEGEINLESAILQGMRETRQYAKRQLTWFRHQMAEATVIDVPYSKSMESRIMDMAQQFLLTGEERKSSFQNF